LPADNSTDTIPIDTVRLVVNAGTGKIVRKNGVQAMGALKRFVKSVRQRGIVTTLVRFYIVIVDYFFDVRYGTDTLTWARLDTLTIESDNKERGNLYQASRTVTTRKLFNSIKPMLPADGVLVDIGCGKGRVLLLASEFGFRKAVGVEFAHELCEIAEKNCAIYKRKTATSTEFQVIEADAAKYVVNDDENVFFLCNPFDEIVMGKVLNNISASLRIQPRKTLILYCNPTCGDFMEQQDGFVKSREFMFWGLECVIYSNSESLGKSDNAPPADVTPDRLNLPVE